MKTIELDAFRSDPKRFVHEVESGEVFVVVDHDRRVAEVRPVPTKATTRRPLGQTGGTFESAGSAIDHEGAFPSPEEAEPGEFLVREGDRIVYVGPLPDFLTATSLVDSARNARDRCFTDTTNEDPVRHVRRDRVAASGSPVS